MKKQKKQKINDALYESATRLPGCFGSWLLILFIGLAILQIPYGLITGSSPTKRDLFLVGEIVFWAFVIWVIPAIYFYYKSNKEQSDDDLNKEDIDKPFRL